MYYGDESYYGYDDGSYATEAQFYGQGDHAEGQQQEGKEEEDTPAEAAHFLQDFGY